MIQQQYLRVPDIKLITGLSRSTIFRLEHDGKFPKRRHLTVKTIGWLSTEVEQWMQSRAEVGKENHWPINK